MGLEYSDLWGNYLDANSKSRESDSGSDTPSYSDDDVNVDVLMITLPAMPLITRSLKNELENVLEISVATAIPSVTELSRISCKPKIVIINAAEYMDDRHDALVFLRDICTENNYKIMILGYADEIGVLRRTLSSSIIASECVRPLDVKQVANEVMDQLEKASLEAVKKHVLVVDDSGVALRTMLSLLEGTYRVSVTTSAAGAFNTVNTNRPDLILLDYEMPICSGSQFMSMLRSELNTSDIPVIFLTSKGDPETVREVLSLHPEGYLLKTTPSDKILQFIADFFQKKDIEKKYL